MRRDKTPEILAIVALLFVFVLVVAHWQQSRAFKAEIAEYRLSQKEIMLINDNLNRRNVDDCELERTWYGFKCVDREGKVYRIPI